MSMKGNDMPNLIDKIPPKVRLGAAGVALFAAGIGAGSFASSLHPTRVMAPSAPVSIASLPQTSESPFGRQVSTVKGQVVAVYGDSFALQDATGQILVSTGRRGLSTGLLETAPLVAKGNVVTVQGFSRERTLRAQYLVAADGRVWALGGHGHHRERH